MGDILVLNSGSSSIKFALFEGETERHRGAATGIGGAGEIAFDGAAEAADLPDHKAALAAVLARLAAAGITPATLAAAAHRVVHGGPALTAPTRVTPEVIAAIRDAIPLAFSMNGLEECGRGSSSPAPIASAWVSFQASTQAL